MITRCAVCALVGIGAPLTVVARLPAQPCEPTWSDEFSMGDFDIAVWDLTVFDDGLGGGPTVYAGGSFQTAGGTPASRIARLDGRRWEALGEGVDGSVLALAPCEDCPGSGKALFVGGAFGHAGGREAAKIARWDGAQWSALGAGIGGSFVWALRAVADAFGQGPALFAGGHFQSAGGAPAANVARWNGAGWSPLGGGLDGAVCALAWFDDGSGPALYAGGYFLTAQGTPALHVARWDGGTWSPVGSGLDMTVNTLYVYNDGRGRALYAGGTLGAGGQVACWDGSAWLPVGEGFDDSVHRLAAFDDGRGTGRMLVATGYFRHAGQESLERIAAWDGRSWLPLGAGLGGGGVALATLNNGVQSRAALYVGGISLLPADGVGVRRIAGWDGLSWSAVGGGVSGLVFAMCQYDDGTGSALYVAGQFTGAGGIGVDSIVRWDRRRARRLGDGIAGLVEALAAVDDPRIGPGLYAGGLFSRAGDVEASNVARWNGHAWSSLGGGPAGSVQAMVVHDDGTGPALYVGGRFGSAGGQSASNIARWDGRSWSAVGLGLPCDEYFGVTALAVFDDGKGPSLYAGGDFHHDPYGCQTVLPMAGMARWDGREWRPVGKGLAGRVYSLKVYDDGSGPALYAGGAFHILPDQDVGYRLARWDGTSWYGVPLPPGVPRTGIAVLAGYDDGTGFGPRLYAGGWLVSNPADPSMDYLAAWDGSRWSALDEGIGGQFYSTWVYALDAFDDGAGDGPALFVGGEFQTAGGVRSDNLARWGGCASHVRGDLTGDGLVDRDDLYVLLAAWGPCPVPCPPLCPGDLDGDCTVGVRDLFILLSLWSW